MGRAVGAQMPILPYLGLLRPQDADFRRRGPTRRAEDRDFGHELPHW